MTQNIIIGVTNYSFILKGHAVQKGVDAVQFQIDQHFKRIWNKSAVIVIYGGREPPPPNAYQIVIADTAERLKSLNYKDLTKTGKPLAKLILNDEHKKGCPWTVEFSRLVLTMIIDPELKYMIVEDFVVEIDEEEKPSKVEKYGFAYDICSPCQGFRNSYLVNGHYVTDFLTPSWFVSKALLSGDEKAIFDYCGLITEPFDILDEGFAQIYDFEGGVWTFLKGEYTDDSLIELKPYSNIELRVRDKNKYERSKV